MIRPAFASTTHRPFPPPGRPWAVAMNWLDLAFLHWPVPARALRPHVPAGLEIEERDGSAWLGVVPFRMTGVRARCLPPLPGSGAFPELNVRTYVRAGGRAGVYFFSLDAASALAVRAARIGFSLPYFRAHMQCRRGADAVAYESVRAHPGAPPATLRARWWPLHAPAPPPGDSLQHWLVERYLLFTTGRDGGLRAGHIQHAPWHLAPAELELAACDMTRLLGFDLAGPPPLVHAAGPLAVVAWTLQRADAATGPAAGRP